MKKFKFNLSDFVLISVFLIIAIMLIFRSNASTGTDFETNYSPKQVNQILLTQYNKTPLSDEFNVKGLKGAFITFKYNSLNSLSNNFLGRFFVNSYNKSNFDGASCASCVTTDSCSDSEKNWFNYPVDIGNKDLQNKIKYDHNLLIIDVRDQDLYVEKHIPGAVNMPLLDVVNIMITVDRNTEIVITGDSYIQTKLGSEALQRLSFHRIHRLIPPINKWNGEFESFN